MTDATTRIKNLPIALEALSHINFKGSNILAEDVAICLRRDIKTYQEEQDEKLKTSARPAIPTPDDDIPF